MARALNHSPPPAARIGLVFPVYGWGPPVLLERFVRKLKAAPETYLFAVATCAGHPGGAVSIVRQLFQKRGRDLSAAWTVTMPENYPPLGGAPVPGKQRDINAAAAQRVMQIAAELQQSPQGAFDEPVALWRLLSRVVHPLFRMHVSRADRAFRSDEKCNGCGICAKVCPVDNVELVDGTPRWLGRCEQCYACFHWCPQQAVQYGRSSKQRRYHHPDAVLTDFLK